jgi:hypothetical protein
MAGDGRGGALRVGSRASETPLESPRAMTVLPDGSLAVAQGNARTVFVRIDPAGRVGQIGGWAAFSLNSIAVRGSDVWFIAANGEEAVRSQLGLPTKIRATSLFDASRPGRPPVVTVVDARGRPVPVERRRRLAADFVSAEKVPAVGTVRGLVLLPDGRPVMVPPRGRLYQPLGIIQPTKRSWPATTTSRQTTRCSRTILPVMTVGWRRRAAAISRPVPRRLMRKEASRFWARRGWCACRRGVASSECAFGATDRQRFTAAGVRSYLATVMFCLPWAGAFTVPHGTGR